MGRRYCARWLLIASAFGACGGGEDDEKCDVPTIGRWYGVTVDDELRLGSDGTFDYLGADGCQTDGTFACPASAAPSGSIKVSIDSSVGGSLCLPAGDYVCSYAVDGDRMTYDCGGGVLTYSR